MAVGSYGYYGTRYSGGSKYSGYTPGTLYKRNQVSIGQQMRKVAVKNYVSQVMASGSLIFGQLASSTEQRSILAVREMQNRVVEEMRAKRQSISIKI